MGGGRRRRDADNVAPPLPPTHPDSISAFSSTRAPPPPLPFNLGLKAATISLLRFELRKEEEGGEGENWERRNFGKEDFEDKMLC